MKRLTLIRHAKSDWDHPVPDVERPLNSRGRRDAPLMAGLLTETGPLPECFFVSSSQRTRETAALMNSVWKLNDSRFIYMKELYLASELDIVRTVQNCSDDYSNIALIAHNPGISQAACELYGRGGLSFPTCGMAVMTFDTDNWINFDAAPADLVWFDYPKNHT